MKALDQVVKLEEDVIKAMLKSDVKELDSLISDELIFTDHTGQIITKAADIEAHRSGNLRINSIEPSEQLIKIFNDTAVVTVLKKIKGQYLDDPFEGKIRFSRIWINRDNSWKIVAVHSTVVSN